MYQSICIQVDFALRKGILEARRWGMIVCSIWTRKYRSVMRLEHSVSIRFMFREDPLANT